MSRTHDGEDLTLTLRDGRVLSYAEYGDASGEPAFYFHGHPGCRFEGRLGDEPAANRQVRIIALDRPGYGRSTYQPSRRILDWPADVVQVADALDIDRFAVFGGSGGGPYALACAHEIPHRLTVAGVVSGFGPMDAPRATKGMRLLNRLAFKYGTRLPFVLDLVMGSMARKVRRDPDGAFEQIKKAMAGPDSETLEAPEIKETFKAELAEAFRQGSRGAALDAKLIGRPWGFRLEQIEVEVHLWQGEKDRLVPPSMGRYMAEAIPNSRATFLPDEGHLLVLKRMDEIIDVLSAKSRS
jgi:pimeloyl-ACP methyl ester carboxylesterase